MSLSRRVATMNAEEYSGLISGIARHLLAVGGTTQRELDAWVRPILHALHAGGFDKTRLNQLQKDARKIFYAERGALIGHKFGWIARGALEGGITHRVQDGTLIWRKDKNGCYELRRRDCASQEEIQHWEELAAKEPYVTGKGQIIQINEIDRPGINADVNNLDAPKPWREELRKKIAEQMATSQQAA